MGNLCLYGYANEAWEVALPAEEVPTVLPEPALGINFACDGINCRDWLALFAVHSDSWSSPSHSTTPRSSTTVIGIETFSVMV